MNSFKNRLKNSFELVPVLEPFRTILKVFELWNSLFVMNIQILNSSNIYVIVLKTMFKPKLLGSKELFQFLNYLNFSKVVSKLKSASSYLRNFLNFKNIRSHLELRKMSERTKKKRFHFAFFNKLNILIKVLKL